MALGEFCSPASKNILKHPTILSRPSVSKQLGDMAGTTNRKVIRIVARYRTADKYKLPTVRLDVCSDDPLAISSFEGKLANKV